MSLRWSPVVLVVVLASLPGCTKSQPESAAPPAVPPQAAAADPLATAEAAAMTLGKTLKARLQAELPNGPGAAAQVCAREAQALTAKIAAETGVQVGRASLRLRNPANAGPEWVRAWLEAQGERPAAGVQGFARIDTTPAGRVARVVKPIAVEAACLTCHGGKDTLPPQVAALLAEKYPNDKATGYALGDLRGALWAEAPVK